MNTNIANKISIYKSPNLENLDNNVDKFINDILLDTGASIHIFNQKHLFSKFDENFDPDIAFLEMADGSKTSNIIKGRGTAKIPIKDKNGHNRLIKLENSLYVPQFKKNIISVNLAIKSGFCFNFNDIANETMICPKGNIFKIKNRKHLYFLCNAEINSVVSKSLHIWHQWLGHPNFKDLSQQPKVSNNMKISDTKIPDQCEVCIQSKMCREISKQPDVRGAKPFEKIHIDLNGPIKTDNILNAHYIFGAICDHSQFLHVYIMKSKSDAAMVLEIFLAKIKPFGETHTIRTDFGTEFTSSNFNDILLKRGINHEHSAPYSAWQMGHIERAWRSLFNCTRALLYESKCPKILWPYAVKYAAFLRNRTFNSRLSCTPLEVATGRKPDMSTIFLFGSKCYAFEQFKTKLDPRAKPGVFIGYDNSSKSKLVFDPISHEVKKCLNVKCLNFPFYNENKSSDSDKSTNDNEINKDQENESEINVRTPQVQDDTNLPLHYNLRNRPNISYAENYCNQNYDIVKQNDPLANSLKDVLDNDLNDYFLDDIHLHHCFHINVTTIYLPNTYNQAMQSKEWHKWKEAMDKEMKSLLENNTWELVPIPLDKPVIGGRWVFQLKPDPIQEALFKARYCAQGYTQRLGLNFVDTYAPTAKTTSIRFVSDISIQESLLTHHADVNNAYLNADIDYDDIYIQQPQGYVQDPSYCCKLNKAIYGLKQAAFRWHETVKTFMFSQNLTQCIMDPCVFIRRTETSTLIILIWVDDLIIAASDDRTMKEFKDNFGRSFKIKDLGELRWFLGINFQRTKDKMSLDQSLYVKNILTRFEANDAIPCSTPCEPGIYDLLKEPSEPLENPTVYRALIGSLIYLMTATRPDLAFIITLLSRFMQTPTKMHLKLGRRVLRYLKATVNHKLTYVKSKNKISIVGHSDSDWAGDSDCQSVSGYVFKLTEESALVSWRSGKQSLIAASSCESEYIALFHAASEGLFLRQLLAEFTNEPPKTVHIFGDNMSALKLSDHQANHKKSRHINIKFHFIRKYVEKKFIKLAYIPSRLNMADMCTKPIKAPNMHNFDSIRGKLD